MTKASVPLLWTLLPFHKQEPFAKCWPSHVPGVTESHQPKPVSTPSPFGELHKATTITRTPGKLFRFTSSSGETRCKRPNTSLWVFSTTLLGRNRAVLVPCVAPQPNVERWAGQGSKLHLETAQAAPTNRVTSDGALGADGLASPTWDRQKDSVLLPGDLHSKSRSLWDSHIPVHFKMCVQRYTLPWPEPNCCKTPRPRRVTHKNEEPQHSPPEPRIPPSDPQGTATAAQPAGPPAPTQQHYRDIETWFLMSTLGSGLLTERGKPLPFRNYWEGSVVRG